MPLPLILQAGNALFEMTLPFEKSQYCDMDICVTIIEKTTPFCVAALPLCHVEGRVCLSLGLCALLLGTLLCWHCTADYCAFIEVLCLFKHCLGILDLVHFLINLKSAFKFYKSLDILYEYEFGRIVV